MLPSLLAGSGGLLLLVSAAGGLGLTSFLERLAGESMEEVVSSLSFLREAALDTRLETFRVLAIVGVVIALLILATAAVPSRRRWPEVVWGRRSWWPLRPL